MSEDELRKIVEEEVRAMLGRAGYGQQTPTAAEPAPASKLAVGCSGIARWLRDAEPPGFSRTRPSTPAGPPAPERASGISAPANPKTLARLLSSTPSRIGVGRVGVRYPTSVYLAIRADHAIAKDAVFSESTETFAQRLGCLPLKTLCNDKQEMLLHPARGRRLDEPSLAALSQGATQGCDVQLIVGDGLSAWAAERNVPELLPLMQQLLQGAGFSVGRPLFVRFSRVGVQDQIGVLTKARATVIMLGERPGLGTGDSLSIYLAYGPRLDQDNAEKNCISNVRALGINPAEAARESCEILRRAFAAGRGGVAA